MATTFGNHWVGTKDHVDRGNIVQNAICSYQCALYKTVLLWVILWLFLVVICGGYIFADLEQCPDNFKY